MKLSSILGIVGLIGVLSFLMEQLGIYNSLFSLETKHISNTIVFIGYFIVRAIEDKK